MHFLRLRASRFSSQGIPKNRFYYRKRGSASYIVRGVREVREREREREREIQRERERERERETEVTSPLSR